MRETGRAPVNVNIASVKNPTPANAAADSMEARRPEIAPSINTTTSHGNAGENNPPVNNAAKITKPPRHKADAASP